VFRHEHCLILERDRNKASVRWVEEGRKNKSLMRFRLLPIRFGEAGEERGLFGVADCGMKTIVFCGENPSRDVKFYVSTSKIHTSIQQRRLSQ
jgi:hypothetical protein